MNGGRENDRNETGRISPPSMSLARVGTLGPGWTCLKLSGYIYYRKMYYKRKKLCLKTISSKKT